MATTVSSKSTKTRTARIAEKVPLEPELPGEGEVRLLAYRLYEKRVADGGSGDATSDWIEAERLLSSGEYEEPALD